jgi:hypothetical protein
VRKNTNKSRHNIFNKQAQPSDRTESLQKYAKKHIICIQGKSKEIVNSAERIRSLQSKMNLQ